MRQEEFKASMQKILSFYAVPKTPEDAQQAANYMAATFEAFKWANAFDFEEATKRILPHLSAHKRPMPGELLASLDGFARERQQRDLEAPAQETREQSIARAKTMADRLGPRGACYSFLLAEKLGRPLTPEISIILAGKMALLNDEEIDFIRNQVERGDPYVAAIQPKCLSA